MDLNFIYFWAIVLIFLSIWMERGRPRKEMLKKYPKKVIYKAHLPFGKSWEVLVGEEDLELLRANQFRVKIWFFSMVIPLFSIYSYLVVDVYFDYQKWIVK